MSLTAHTGTTAQIASADGVQSTRSDRKRRELFLTERKPPPGTPTVPYPGFVSSPISTTGTERLPAPADQTQSQSFRNPSASDGFCWCGVLPVSFLCWLASGFYFYETSGQNIFRTRVCSWVTCYLVLRVFACGGRLSCVLRTFFAQMVERRSGTQRTRTLSNARGSYCLQF